MWQDLAALTPPLVVCVAFIIGLAVFLRREMGAGATARPATGADRVTGGLDISRNGGVYAELGRTSALELPDQVHRPSSRPASRMAALTMHPMPDYGELPASRTLVGWPRQRGLCANR